MNARNRAIRSRLRRKGRPGDLTERLGNLTKIDRPPSLPDFGSGVIAPGTSRYQRMSAHLPSGVTRFQGIGVLPADAAIDLTSGEPTLDLRV